MNNQDLKLLERDRQLESNFHNIIINNSSTQKDLYNILGYNLELGNPYYIHEDKYINGITSDFTIIFGDKIKAIIECKAGNIGVTDYVRGIGQVLQYEYFFEHKINNRGLGFYEDFKTVLLMPSSVFQNKNFNIAKFKYPQTTILIEINSINNAVREITKKEIDKFLDVQENNLISISQYYVRDNRIFEFYILLKYLCFLKLKGNNEINRSILENRLVKEINVINNGNWRNVFISLSSLGLIDSKNSPTNIGLELGMKEYEEFALIIYKSYIKPYIDVLNIYLCSENNINKSNQEITKGLIENYGGNDVLFLTQSKGRYISSWLNILRDDYGIVNFQSRSNNRTLNYIISELNDEAILLKIKQFSRANVYLDELKKIIK